MPLSWFDLVLVLLQMLELCLYLGQKDKVPANIKAVLTQFNLGREKKSTGSVTKEAQLIPSTNSVSTKRFYFGPEPSDFSDQ